jgi:enoyl-CoA hydratase/carnithine racemase
MSEESKDITLVHRISPKVAQITLNRPERLNALSEELSRGLSRSLRELGKIEEIESVIITGAGKRGFCTGMDLKLAAAKSEEERNQSLKAADEMWEELGRFPKTLIAAVNGYAVGAGFQIALNCDLIIASESARFAMTETRIGASCVNGAWLLTPIVGLKRAADLTLTSRWLNSTDAYEWGIASRVVQDSDLLDEARRLATDLSERGLEAMTWTRRGLRAIRDQGGLSAEGSTKLRDDGMKASNATSSYSQ